MRSTFKDTGTSLHLEVSYALDNFRYYCCTVVVGSNRWNRWFIDTRTAGHCGNRVDFQCDYWSSEGVGKIQNFTRSYMELSESTASTYNNPLVTSIKRVVYDDPLVTIIKRIVDGSQLDLAKLFDNTSQVIFALVVRIVGNRAVAEEVLLDIYVQVWNQSARYDQEGETPTVWLGQLARKQALDYLKTNGSAYSQLPPHVTIETAFNVRDMRPEAIWQRSVREALELLPPEQRQALEMAYFGGFDCEQIGEELRLSPGIIQNRIAIAMKCLRQKLTKSPDYQSAEI